MISLQENVGALLDLKPNESEGIANAKVVCFLLAQGEPVESVAKKLGMMEEHVVSISRSRDGSELIIRLQSALFPDVQLRIKRTAHMALDKKVRMLLTSTNDALVNTVATDLLDRSQGKATQVTENRNINFDVKDADSLDRAISASAERLAKIETMKRALRSSEPVTTK